MTVCIINCDPLQTAVCEMECSDENGKTYAEAVSKHHRDVCLSPQDFQSLARACKPKSAELEIRNILLSRGHSPALMQE